MKKVLMFLVIFGLTVGFNSLVYSQGDQDYKAWITVESQDSHLSIKAYCLNNTSEGSLLKYQLKAVKCGSAGRTSSSQSGYVYLGSQEKQFLSQLGLGVSPKDEYRIKLEVYKGEKLVAEDSVFYPRGLRL